MASDVEFVVYMNGVELRVFQEERDAQDLVRLYDGENEVWYEKSQKEDT